MVHLTVNDRVLTVGKTRSWLPAERSLARPEAVRTGADYLGGAIIDLCLCVYASYFLLLMVLIYGR